MLIFPMNLINNKIKNAYLKFEKPCHKVVTRLNAQCEQNASARTGALIAKQKAL